MEIVLKTLTSCCLNMALSIISATWTVIDRDYQTEQIFTGLRQVTHCHHLIHNEAPRIKGGNWNATMNRLRQLINDCEVHLVTYQDGYLHLWQLLQKRHCRLSEGRHRKSRHRDQKQGCFSLLPSCQDHRQWQLQFWNRNEWLNKVNYWPNKHLVKLKMNKYWSSKEPSNKLCCIQLLLLLM